MCTVSFVYVNGTTIITSNRDEKVDRQSAIEPKNYLIDNKNIIFPKDPKAGGTWYAVRKDRSVLVLLNGAKEKHQVQSHYRKSRGLIVLDLISSNSILTTWQEIDLENIEPFTIVLFIEKELYQLQWNYKEKSLLLLNSKQSYIWSSSTLYPKEISEKRAHWFETFIDTKPEVSADELFHFHRYAEEKNHQNGLVINRNDELKTVSITQTVINQNKATIFYNDLIAQKSFSNAFITV